MELTVLLTTGLAGAAAGMCGLSAGRELALASPALLRWFHSAVEPLLRVGREGHEPTTGERRRLAVLGTLGLSGCGWAVGGWPLAGCLVVAGPAVVSVSVSRRRARYRRSVERALPDLALALADALAGGRSIRGSVAPAAASLDGPVAAELARVRADLELGAATASALGGLRRRLRSDRVDTFVATLLSPRVGGEELAALLRRHGSAAAERDRLSAEVRGATAQARFTGLLVVAMPVAGALFGELIQPGFIPSMFSSPAAASLLLASGAMQVVGFTVIRRLGAVDCG